MKKRHSAEQIVGLLRQADVDLGKGMTVPDVGRHLGVSQHTYYRRRTKVCGMDPKMAKQLQELQKENSRLETLPAGCSAGQRDSSGESRDFPKACAAQLLTRGSGGDIRLIAFATDPGSIRNVRTCVCKKASDSGFSRRRHPAPDPRAHALTQSATLWSKARPRPYVVKGPLTVLAIAYISTPRSSSRVTRCTSRKLWSVRLSASRNLLCRTFQARRGLS